MIEWQKTIADSENQVRELQDEIKDLKDKIQKSGKQERKARGEIEYYA